MECKMTAFFSGRTGYSTLAFLLMVSFVSTGANLEETYPSSSQRRVGPESHIRIQISESINKVKTSDSILAEKTDPQGKSVSIRSTDFPTNSSYFEKIHSDIEESTLTGSTENDLSQGKTDSVIGRKQEKNIEDVMAATGISSNYYEVIKPTKTIGGEEMKIRPTKLRNDEESSGEAEGVSINPSMNVSRPQQSVRLMNYKRFKRGFGNSWEESSQESQGFLRTGRKEQGKKKVERSSAGKSYNEVAESLEKIAKVTINEDEETIKDTTTPSDGFRESRDEENRKASPDIQDIITGIVNILNGKGTKQNEAPHSGRPSRPTNVRINNRGPPKISDVPPLDFDGPPPYRPLPPPKRIPPPYPFDIPPSMPNIPLPPQPHKPGFSKLPSHPFLEGVPIPELVVPGAPAKKPPVNRPADHLHLQYDTISSSEPFINQNMSIVKLNGTPKPEVTQTPATISAATTATVTPKTEVGLMSNASTFKVPSVAANVTNVKNELNKTKVSGSKPSQGGTLPNKNSNNKRVRPNPSPPRPSDKVQPVKSSTSATFAQEVKSNKTEPLKIENGAADSSEDKTQNSTESNSTASYKPELQNNVTETSKPAGDSFQSSNHTFIPSANEPEKKKNRTEELAAENSAKVSTEKTAEIASHNDTKVEFDFELPILLEPTLGYGEATPVLESSFPEHSLPFAPETTRTQTAPLATRRPYQPPSTASGSSHPFKARPGIVLDDPEYKPGVHKRPLVSARPIVTAPPPHSYFGEIFDVTVHAVQGPGEESSMPGKPYIVPVDIERIQLQTPHVAKGDVAVITKPEEGQKFVSIDGKRTYINLFGEVSSTKISPTSTQPTIIGTGYAVPHKENPSHSPPSIRPAISTSPPRRPPYKRPSHPPVRIDTCIVGDDSTCDSAQNEMCKTEDGVSSCHCRPGYNRKKHRDTCRRVVSILTSIRVDRLYDKRIKWQESYKDPESEDYQQLSYEASQAIESAMSMTPFSDDFINSRINSIYSAKNLENNEPAVYVNITMHLEENMDTVRPTVKQDIQRHLLRVIQRRNNNLGNSAVWVDAPSGSVLALQDVDECSSAELHDCHERAVCLNTFGGFKCQCPSGSRDPWMGNVHREGRFCESCPSDYCNGRGECKFELGQQVCHCSGSFYGSQCEIDGEVLGVAIGASVAAAIIIILTLVCLCMWSRRWSREQKSAVGAGMGSPVFGYMATGPTVKTPSVGAPPYQVSIEDRIRWAQIADVMAKSNHYAQPEPANKPSRPAFGGYPTLPSHTLSMTGTLPLPAVAPPVPLPRLTLTNKSMMGTYGAHSQIGSVHQGNHGLRSSLETTSSSEEEDRADLLGRNFNAPRPKSRTSIANQSGIYYDVEYDRSDIYSKQNTIPMNTYTHQTRPYFR